MARRMGQNISVGCSWSAVVGSLPTVTRGGTKPEMRCWAPRLIDAQEWCNEGYPVWSEPTEGLLRHNAHKMNYAYGRNVLQHSASHSCCIWGCIAQTANDDPCPLSKALTMGTWMSELDLGRRSLDPMSPIFLLHHMDSRVRVHHLPGVVMAPGCILGGQQASSRNVLLGNPGSSHSCGCKFSTSLHDSSVPFCKWPLSTQ